MLISSKDNPNIKLYSKLCSSKKVRDEYNLFTLEGIRIVVDAFQEGVDFHLVLIAEEALERFSHELKPLITAISPEKIMMISRDLANKISETKNTQGVFAIAKKLDKIISTDKILSVGKYLVLNNIQDPGNLGTIIRTADAIGISGIFLTNDCCDLYNPKVIRSTMGSVVRMKIFEGCDYREIISLLKENHIRTFAAVIDKDALDVSKCDFSNGCGVVIGNEGNGLTDEDKLLCDHKITIKMRGNVNSLNAAMASGIIMWEMLR